MGGRLGVLVQSMNTRGTKKRKVDELYRTSELPDELDRASELPGELDGMSKLPDELDRTSDLPDELDRTSDLPDDILGSILSHLSMEEAARMSILSSRWRDLWIIRGSVLNFYDRKAMDWHWHLHWRSLNHQMQFIDWVDRVLEKHKEPTLNELTVKSDWLCNSTLTERIFHWIYFAIQKRVQRLDLSLSSMCYLTDFLGRLIGDDVPSRPSPHEGHNFPRLNFLLSEVEGFSSFVVTLKVLRLQCFNVDEELLTYLLSTCPVLETLSVSFTQSLVNLQVRAPSVVNLKHFEICCCYCIKTIHFDDAPNLECIRCIGLDVTISIKSAPRLINVSLGKLYPYMLGNLMHLSKYFSQLEVLTLEVEGEPCIDVFGFWNFPSMMHLKKLILRLDCHDSVLDLNDLLRAMPSLYHLHLKVEKQMSSISSRVKPPGSIFCHESLKLVEWDGYQGDDNDYDFVKFLVETCKVLEKFTITRRRPNNELYNNWYWNYHYKQPCAEIEKSAMMLLESKGVEVMMQ